MSTAVHILSLCYSIFTCTCTGRLEETEEELVQLKIERETDRQRKAKYGTEENGTAVEAVNSESSKGGGEPGEDGVAGDAGGSLEQVVNNVAEGDDKSQGEDGTVIPFR